MQGKKKHKKISFQLYLERSPSPVNKELYPVYLRINFNADSTKVKDVLFNEQRLYWSKEDLEKWNRGDYEGSYRGEAKEMQLAMQFYEDIIRFEYAQNPDKFLMKGLGERARIYRTSILEILQKRVRQWGIVELSLHNDFSRYDNISTGKLFVELATMKVKNLSFPLRIYLESYILFYLYTAPFFNLNFANQFGESIFHFVIKNGLNEFSTFLKDYFSKNSKSIDFTWLENSFSRNYAEKRDLEPLLNNFSPTEDKIELYLNLVKTHVSLEMEKM